LDRLLRDRAERERFGHAGPSYVADLGLGQVGAKRAMAVRAGDRN
jgi:hypothetical protein